MAILRHSVISADSRSVTLCTISAATVAGSNWGSSWGMEALLRFGGGSATRLERSLAQTTTNKWLRLADSLSPFTPHGTRPVVGVACAVLWSGIAQLCHRALPSFATGPPRRRLRLPVWRATTGRANPSSSTSAPARPCGTPRFISMIERPVHLAVVAPDRDAAREQVRVHSPHVRRRRPSDGCDLRARGVARALMVLTVRLCAEPRCGEVSDGPVRPGWRCDQHRRAGWARARKPRALVATTGAGGGGSGSIHQHAPGVRALPRRCRRGPPPQPRSSRSPMGKPRESLFGLPSPGDRRAIGRGPSIQVAQLRSI